MYAPMLLPEQPSAPFGFFHPDERLVGAPSDLGLGFTPGPAQPFWLPPQDLNSLLQAPNLSAPAGPNALCTVDMIDEFLNLNDAALWESSQWVSPEPEAHLALSQADQSFHGFPPVSPIPHGLGIAPAASSQDGLVLGSSRSMPMHGPAFVPAHSFASVPTIVVPSNFSPATTPSIGLSSPYPFVPSPSFAALSPSSLPCSILDAAEMDAMLLKSVELPACSIPSPSPSMSPAVLPPSPSPSPSTAPAVAFPVPTSPSQTAASDKLAASANRKRMLKNRKKRAATAAAAVSGDTTESAPAGPASPAAEDGAAAPAAPADSDSVDRPFKCTDCSKTFLRKQDLKRHEIIHDPRSPGYRCNHCGTGFTRSDALYRHIKTKRCF